MLRIFAVVALVPMVAACTVLQVAAQEKNITPQQTAAIQTTCSKVMRLREGQPEFIACVSSLSNSLAYAAVSDYAADAYLGCTKTGLRRGTPEFSRCVLDRENNARDNGHSPSGANRFDAAYVTPADSSSDDYFRTTNQMRQRREQYACAQLGLEPNSEPMLTCAHNLDTAIFESEFPPG